MWIPAWLARVLLLPMARQASDRMKHFILAVDVDPCELLSAGCLLWVGYVFLFDPRYIQGQDRLRELLIAGRPLILGVACVLLGFVQLLTFLFASLPSIFATSSKMLTRLYLIRVGVHITALSFYAFGYFLLSAHGLTLLQGFLFWVGLGNLWGAARVASLVNVERELDAFRRYSREVEDVLTSSRNLVENGNG